MKAWCIEHRAKGKGQRAMGISMSYAPCSMPFTQQGFSLVELLISMVIATIVGLAGFVIFSTSNWSYKVQEDVAEAQQNVRVAMERLAKDIRTAGFGLPEPPFSLTFGTTTFTSPITVSDSSANADTITILGIGYEAGKLQKGSETDCNETGKGKVCLDSVSDFLSSGAFKAERKYINIGGTTFITLSTSQTDISNNKLILGNPSSLDRNFPNDTQVYIIQAVRYTIANDLTGCSAANPCLASLDYTGLRGGTGNDRQPLAENIEDIQFAYGMDGTISPNFERDGKVDYSGTYDSTAFWNDPTDDSSIIAVRATVVAKTRNEDPRGAKVFKRPEAENHAAGSIDGYRRRTVTKIIKLRNARTGG